MARVVIDTRPIRSLQGDKILEGSVYKRLLEARQRKPDVPILPEQSEQSEPAASFFFLRYIGHPQYEINEPILDEWVSYLTSWLREASGKPTSSVIARMSASIPGCAGHVTCAWRKTCPCRPCPGMRSIWTPPSKSASSDHAANQRTRPGLRAARLIWSTTHVAGFPGAGCAAEFLVRRVSPRRAGGRRAA